MVEVLSMQIICHDWQPRR